MPTHLILVSTSYCPRDVFNQDTLYETMYSGEAPGQAFKAWSSGLDKVEFLLAAGPAEPLQPLRNVASGGESARVMLALKAAPSEACWAFSGTLFCMHMFTAHLLYLRACPFRTRIPSRSVKVIGHAELRADHSIMRSLFAVCSLHRFSHLWRVYSCMGLSRVWRSIEVTVSATRHCFVYSSEWFA
jgi:hypothetical protein